MTDSPPHVAALFVLALVSSVCLALGYKTRWAGWICWILLLGLQVRNPLILHKGDRYLVLILFWGNFLPWGKSFSGDHGFLTSEDEKVHLSWGSVALFLQICCLYWFSAVTRVGPEWQVDGSALYYTYHLEPILNWMAVPMLSTGEAVLEFFTRAALLMEMFGPLLLFIPVPWIRFVSILLVMGFHIGIMATLSLGLFTWVCIAAPLGLLPSRFWEWRLGAFLETHLQSAALVLHRLRARFLSRLWVPSEWSTLLQRFTRWLPAVALVLTLTTLVINLGGPVPFTGPTAWARVLGLDQSWGMFSPSPPKISGWVTADATTRSGREFNLLTGDPVPPGSFRGHPSSVWDQRWRFYRANLQSVNFGVHASIYLNYLVRQWDAAHPEDPIQVARYNWHARSTQLGYRLAFEETLTEAEYHR